MAVLACGYLVVARLRLNSGGSPVTPSVAVLPIAAPGNDAEADSLAESMADDLTNDLAQVSGIRVASQMVVRTVNHPLDVQAAAQQLKVAAVVSGSLKKTADDMRVVLNLVDAQTGAQIWGQIYSCRPQACSALDTDIAQEVAFRLELKTEASRPRRARPEPAYVPAAETAYQKGEQAMAEHTPASFAQAIDDFQQAVDADPRDAPAMAELSYGYALMAYNYNRPEAPVALMNQAEQTARRALQLDSTSAEAYSALADVEVLKDFNWTAAEKDFRRAIELDPGYLPAHTMYALNVLTALGRFAEARAQCDYIDRAPNKTPGAIVSAALADYFAGRYAESVTRLDAARPMIPSSWLIVEATADNDLALGETDKALALLNGTPAPTEDDQLIRSVSLGIVYARTGRRQEALRELEQTEKSGDRRLNYHLAALMAALGYNDKALAYLDNAVSARESDIMFLQVDPLLVPLRTSPRFQALETKLNLVEDKENQL
jgi:eukaryotic-like serine/threonine-protein kinase